MRTPTNKPFQAASLTVLEPCTHVHKMKIRREGPVDQRGNSRRDQGGTAGDGRETGTVGWGCGLGNASTEDQKNPEGTPRDGGLGMTDRRVLSARILSNYQQNKGFLC